MDGLTQGALATHLGRALIFLLFFLLAAQFVHFPASPLNFSEAKPLSSQILTIITPTGFGVAFVGI